jgi:hypothetical protein
MICNGKKSQIIFCFGRGISMALPTHASILIPTDHLGNRQSDFSLEKWSLDVAGRSSSTSCKESPFRKCPRRTEVSE